MLVFCAISAARAATSCASGCGVVTTTASARGRSWPSEIATLPVPGGMSTTERVELAPVDVCQELLERSVQHRAAPHHGLVVVEEEPDRHQLQIAADRRHDHAIDCDRSSGRSRADAGSSARRRPRRGPRSCCPSPENATAKFAVNATCRRRPCRWRPRAHGSNGRSAMPFVRSVHRAGQPRGQGGALLGGHHVELELPPLDAAPRRKAPGATCSSELERSGQPATVRAIVDPPRRPPRPGRRAPCQARSRAASARGRSPPRAPSEWLREMVPSDSEPSSGRTAERRAASADTQRCARRTRSSRC